MAIDEVTDSRVGIYHLQTHLSIVASVPSINVKYVWKLERVVVFFSHCFKHVCSCDNNLPAAFTFSDDHFATGTISNGKFQYLPRAIMIPSAASMISSVADTLLVFDFSEQLNVTITSFFHRLHELRRRLCSTYE